MSLQKLVIFFLLALCTSHSLYAKAPKPSHLMIGPGLFGVDRKHPRLLGQIEYRWEVNCHNIRPLAALFMTTDTNFYVCGGIGYDIFVTPWFVITPTFAPGLYHQGHGKKLGFPLNFRSGLETAFIFSNKGRFGVQFNHISNAGMLHKNPGANSLYIFYAIPFPPKKKGASHDTKHN